MEERISLEEKLAWLEHYVSELDGVVRGLAGQVEELQAQITVLRTARGEAEEGPPDGTMSLVYEKPPHY